MGSKSISHPQKIYFPEPGISKQEVMDYYNDAWPRIKPHLQNRPLTLERYPNGIAEAGFYQKNIPDHFPDRLPRLRVDKKEGENKQTFVRNKGDLLALVDQGVLSFHIWQSEKADLRQATRLVIDLDPSRSDLNDLKKAARRVRDALRQKGLLPKVMCTGKSGLHVYASLEQPQKFDALRDDLQRWCTALTKQYPEQFTLEQRKEKRKGKILLDYWRNAYGQTSICPYSLRPTKKATLACPVEWGALSRLKATDFYHLKNIRRRWAQLQD